MVLSEETAQVLADKPVDSCGSRVVPARSFFQKAKAPLVYLKQGYFDLFPERVANYKSVRAKSVGQHMVSGSR